MGQRLNIEIHNNGNVIANSYYHWSGYTSEALQLTGIIIDGINELKEIDNAILLAVTLLQLTGAGISENELSSIENKSISNLISFNKSIDRSSGIIGVSKEAIEETRRWEEARVEIDIETKNIKLNLCSETYKEDLDNHSFFEGKESFFNVSFNNFNNIKNEILLKIKQKQYFFVLNDKYYCFIE